MDPGSLIAAPLALPAGWAAGALWLDHYGRSAIPAGPWDAIAVAGCKVHDDGRASRALDRRVRRAVELWGRGLAPRIILTGARIGGSPCSEADCAADLARSLGVPADRLLIEDRSRTTAENAAFTAELLPREAAVLVVTCSWHRWRAERLFRRHFRRVGSAGATPPPRERWRGASRELVSVAAAWWRGRL